MKTYRIAVCLTGQLRTWEICHENIKSFFDVKQCPHLTEDHEVQIDYFIHTWDKNSWKRENKAVDVPVSPEEFKLLDAVYSPKAMRVDRSLGPVTGCSWDGLFRSAMTCIHLKKQYELENHIEYDLVIKSRFDLVFPPGSKFIIHPMDTMVAYTNQPMSKFSLEYFGNDFHDIIYYGDSPTMDLVGDCHREYRARCAAALVASNAKHGDWPSDLRYTHYGPGVVLWRYLVSMNIHPDWVNRIAYTIVREQVRDEGLDPIADYKRVREIYLEWYK